MTNIDDIYNEEDETAEEFHQNSNLKFICPKCGEVTQDEVMFLCNTCDNTEMIYQNGTYMCPSCLVPGENFQCLKCDSKEVVLKATN